MKMAGSKIAQTIELSRKYFGDKKLMTNIRINGKADKNNRRHPAFGAQRSDFQPHRNPLAH